jgi:hypothetical protein
MASPGATTTQPAMIPEGATAFGNGNPQGVQGGVIVATGLSATGVGMNSEGSFVRFTSLTSAGVPAYWDLFVDSSGKLRISSSGATTVGAAGPANTESGGTIVGTQS